MLPKAWCMSYAFVVYFKRRLPRPPLQQISRYTLQFNYKVMYFKYNLSAAPYHKLVLARTCSTNFKQIVQ